MGLNTLFSRLVAVANTVTGSLQDTITLYRRTGQNAYGDPTYTDEDPITVKCAVEHGQFRVLSSTGEVIFARAKITVLDPSIVISTLDKIVLSDHSTGPILAIPAQYINPATSRGYITEVLIG